MYPNTKNVQNISPKQVIIAIKAFILPTRRVQAGLSTNSDTEKAATELSETRGTFLKPNPRRKPATRGFQHMSCSLDSLKGDM